MGLVHTHELDSTIRISAKLMVVVHVSEHLWGSLGHCFFAHIHSQVLDPRSHFGGVEIGSIMSDPLVRGTQDSPSLVERYKDRGHRSHQVRKNVPCVRSSSPPGIRVEEPDA